MGGAYPLGETGMFYPDLEPPEEELHPLDDHIKSSRAMIARELDADFT